MLFITFLKCYEVVPFSAEINSVTNLFSPHLQIVSFPTQSDHVRSKYILVLDRFENSINSVMICTVLGKEYKSGFNLLFGNQDRYILQNQTTVNVTLHTPHAQMA